MGFRAGGVPWNKGRPLTPEHRSAVSEAMKGKRPTFIPDNRGLVRTPEQRRKISETLKAKGIKPPRPPRSSLPRGERHHWWRGGASSATTLARASFEYQEWRKKVFERDKYTCVHCGYKGRNLTADHIKPFALFPKLRYRLSNGRTLCVECHRKTPTWGVNVSKQRWRDEGGRFGKGTAQC